MMHEKWRSTTDADMTGFAEWLRTSNLVRQGRGRLTHPEPDFEGDPIDQAVEETLDNLFYLYYAKRQQEEERANRPPYMSKLGDLLQKLVWSLQSGIMMKEATIDLDGITFKITGSRLDKGDRPFEFKITIKEKTSG